MFSIFLAIFMVAFAVVAIQRDVLVAWAESRDEDYTRNEAGLVLFCCAMVVIGFMGMAYNVLRV